MLKNLNSSQISVVSKYKMI